MWRDKEYHLSTATYTASLASNNSTTTAPVISTKIVLTKKVISNLNINTSKEEEKETKEVRSNLNGVAAATAATNNDEIDNLKF